MRTNVSNKGYYGCEEVRIQMLLYQHSDINGGRPATFFEELKAVAEIFAVSLVVALLGVALFVIF